MTRTTKMRIDGDAAVGKFRDDGIRGVKRNVELWESVKYGNSTLLCGHTGYSTTYALCMDYLS